ncbi:CPBP family intramembrane metalloprotease [Blautia sp. TF11-31AT]|nr:CPBP family intramembrane metalloprotease [Blautia sp. TF11-31AT]
MSQVILFDLDGTLTESGEGIINCVQYALEKLGKKEEHPENLQCFIGPPLKEQFMKYAGLSEEEGEKAVVYYRERYTTTGIFENRLYPKIPELLELLKINNKILAVASSKPEVYVKQILEHFQIADYFTAIVGSELDGRRTEKAEVIEEALRRMHLEEERDKVLMVGDRSHDVQGAISCGLQCIGVAYGYGSREELEKAGAVYIADSVEDLGILASPNDEETTENVESVRNIIPDREKVKKYEIPETRKLEKEEKEMPESAKKKEKFRYSTAGQIWRLIYPFLIHYGATLLATIALYLVYLIQAGGLQETASAGQRLINSTLYVTLIGDLTAAMILYLFYRKDQMHRKEGFSGTGKAFVWAPPVIWFSVIILAIATGQFLNDLINGLHLNDLFTGYSEVSEQAFSGQPVGLMILVVGIIGPICEELMFRGIVFHRLKDWVKPQAAIVISALLFGIYHGNVVQFFYATCMGVMLAIIYDKTGTLWISIVAHIAANLWSLFGSSFWSSLWQQIPAGMLFGVMIEILLCVIPTYWLFGYKRK